MVGLFEAQQLCDSRYVPRFAQVDTGLPRVQQGVDKVRPVLLPLAATAVQEGTPAWDILRSAQPAAEDATGEWTYRLRIFEFREFLRLRPLVVAIGPYVVAI